MHIQEKISNKIDFFLTDSAESISLGSLHTSGGKPSNQYAFIGLPFFCTYEHIEEIPLEDLQFATLVDLLIVLTYVTNNFIY